MAEVGVDVGEVGQLLLHSACYCIVSSPGWSDMSCPQTTSC